MHDAAGLILTAGDPLARSLRADYALRQRQAGQRVWRTPRILSLRQWLIDRWAETWPTEQLISTPQALALWLDVVERDQPTLLSALACARAALHAEQRALDYRIDPQRLSAHTEEQQAWQRWRRSVRARMRRQDWLLPGDLPSPVMAALAGRHGSLPDNIELHGFGATATPAERQLLTALAAQADVRHVGADVDTASPAVTRYHCSDAEAQCRHVAALVAERLQASAEPPRIVVVLPDIDARRDMLEQALCDLVAPWRRQVGDTRGAPWRWESGRPLGAQTWVEAADGVFALTLERNPQDAVSRLLLSPVLWPGATAEAAALDVELRRLSRPWLRLETVCEHAPPALRPRLLMLLQTLREEPRRAMPSTWAERLLLRLQALGWPGTSALPSSMFQTVRELQQRLARLGAMDGVLGAIELSRARMWLGELLRAGFEPRAEHEQPVTLATPEEALYMTCDLLLICDACIDAFPARSAPSPFLALEAQRAAGIPESSPALQLAQARNTIAALYAQAAEVQVLAPLSDERGAERLPAAVFGDGWQPLPPRARRSASERQAAAISPLLRPTADPVPPVTPAETVRGDAGLFTAWFESPFFAFCTHRLGLQPLPQAGHGLDPRLQGQVLHAALDHVWGELQTQTALRALDDAGLDQRLSSALQIPLARYLPERDFGRVLARLEAQRLLDLLRQWLHHEVRRVDGFTVVAREAPLTATLACLPLSLRVDRVDRVDTALGPRWLVLDYKTGRDADPRGWDEDRLHDPQLPLYATLSAQLQLDVPRIDGIGFAHLKDGHPALSAATDWCATLLDVDTRPKRDWDEQLAAWSTRLTAAARGFLDGVAGVDPGLPEQSRYRWLLPLTGDVTGADEGGG